MDILSPNSPQNVGAQDVPETWTQKVSPNCGQYVDHFWDAGGICSKLWGQIANRFFVFQEIPSQLHPANNPWWLICQCRHWQVDKTLYPLLETSVSFWVGLFWILARSAQEGRFLRRVMLLVVF